MRLLIRGLHHLVRAVAPGVLVVMVIAGASTPTGAAPAGRAARITLLPRPSAAGSVWDWTASCPLGPLHGALCAGAGPVLGSAQLNGDEWNLGVTDPAEGDVRMTVTRSGGLTVQGELPVAPPCTASTCLAPSANTWVRGYTNVAYGKNPCRAATSPVGVPALRLPVKVRALPSDLVATTSYSSLTSQTTFDIAYDMWLNPSGTQYPCRTQGTVEVMLWTDYDVQALLPPSTRIATVTVPYAVGHHPHPGTDAWSAYVVNVDRAGVTASYGGTVFLVLDAKDVVAAGTVSIDVTKALSAAGRVLEQDYGWTDFADHYWLDTIPFGMEFGPADAQPWGGGSTAFMLDLTSYCLALHATVTRPRC